MKKVEASSDSERTIIKWALLLAGFLLVADQVTKLLVVHFIGQNKYINIIDGFFRLTYINNPGAAYGILAGKVWLLLLISAVVLVLILVYLRALTEGWVERYFAIFMIAGGIAGNSIDRIWRRQVVDFLDFMIFSYNWPAFNVADSAITTGITIFIISSVFRPPRSRKDSEGMIFQR